MKKTTSEKPNVNRQRATGDVYTDPVSYLAEFGIETELVAETRLPEAA